MGTWHIHITGQVQGVGFRPFVWSLAHELRLMGTVANTSDGVHIYVNGHADLQYQFLKLLVERAPEKAIINQVRKDEVPEMHFDDFKIVESEQKFDIDLAISPDFGICGQCAEEVMDPGNRRFQYPFITCTQCGPRFSIMEGLPYDRHLTSMDSFEMCGECDEEYLDPKDKRYFSQTNSCHVCGVNLFEIFPDRSKTTVDHIISKLRAGEIIAVKGTAGYLLMCRAMDTSIVKKLRERKKRPRKPFALLADSIARIEQYVDLSEKEKEALQSSERPIVVCGMNEAGRRLSEVAPGLDSLGFMLPFDALTLVITRSIGEPLIATSGNVHQSPILCSDEGAIEELASIADTIISHDRLIVYPQDDSVMRFSPKYKRPIIIRRSKGMSPSYWGCDLPLPAGVVALGSDLKATFAICTNSKVYISPFLGNLESWEAQQRYQSMLESMLNLLQLRPSYLLIDRHPTYFSSQLPLNLEDSEIKSIPIQHHYAHFGACLLENGLVHTEREVLGVIWDGLGWGDDNSLWGGEFMLYDHGQFVRVGHIQYFPYFLGDKMSKEPRLAAFSMLQNSPEGQDCIRDYFSEKEWNYYIGAISKERSLSSSSMGRIFDAVAAFLGLCSKNSYEGEAGMLLEAAAQRYADMHGYPPLDAYNMEYTIHGEALWMELLQSIIEAKSRGESVGKIALDFHVSLVGLILNVANRVEVKDLAFSGGVFQNALLIDLLIYHLSPLDFTLFFHKKLSPNDENISAGQLTVHYIETHFVNHQKQDYVLSDTR